MFKKKQFKIRSFEFILAEINIEKIKKFTSENDFMNLSVELFKELAIVTTIISDINCVNKRGIPKGFNRNEAILNGLIIRINKLQSGILDQTCQKRLEICYILLRCLYESLINLKYLLQGGDDLFDEFVEYSLRKEKELYNKINKNIGKRGTEIPIEKRMKKSIENTFNVSSMKFEDVNEKNRQSWGDTIFKRAEDVGMDWLHLSLFGLPSHSVHGNWQDLINYHLSYKNKKFIPNRNWNMPRPQYLLAIGIISIEILKSYLNHTMKACVEKENIERIIDDIGTRMKIVDSLHEKFLQEI